MQHKIASKKDQDKTTGLLGLSTTGLLGLATTAGTINPAAERILGVQRFIHGTGNRNVPSILAHGLQTSYGGGVGGSGVAIGSQSFINNSRGRVHVASDNLLGRLIAKMHAGLVEEFGGNKSMLDLSKREKTLREQKGARNILRPFGTHKGTLLYGSMPFEKFNDLFTTDPDYGNKRFAFRSSEDLPKEMIGKSRHGLLRIFKNRSSNLLGYIKNNPARFSRGVGLLGLSGLGAGTAYHAVKNIID